VASEAAEIVPPAQFLQESAKFISSEYLPGTQTVHEAAAAAQYLPTLHEEQEALPELPAYFPAAQLSQAEAMLPLFLPVWHSVHIVPPKLPLYLPAEQLSHAAWSTPLVEPRAHGVHAEPSSFIAVASAPAYFPAAQLLQSL